MVISGPVDPVFMAFLIPKYLNKYSKVYGNILKQYYFNFLELRQFVKFGPTKPLCFFVFWTPPPKKIGIYYRFWRTFSIIRFGNSQETTYFDKMQNHKQIPMNQTYFSKKMVVCLSKNSKIFKVFDLIYQNIIFLKMIP